MNPVVQMIESAREAGAKLEMPSKAELARHAAMFALALLSGRAVLPGGFAPFAVAAFAAMYQNKLPASALLGCAVGALLRLDWSAIAAMAVFFALAAALHRYTGKRSKRVTLLSVAVAASVGLLFDLGSPYDALMGVLALLAAVALTGVYAQSIKILKTIGRRRLLFDEELIALCLSAGTLILGIADLSLYYISPSVIAAGAAALLLASLGGAGMGAAGGVSLGAVLAASGRTEFMMAIGVAGLVAGSVNRLGKPLCAAGFVIAAAAMVFYARAEPLLIVNFAVAAVVFLLLPASLYQEAGRFVSASLRKEQGRRDYLARLQDISAQKLKGFADVFYESGKIFRDGGKKASAGWDVSALSPICAGCTSETACWSDSKRLSAALNENLHGSSAAMQGCKRLTLLTSMAGALVSASQRESRLRDSLSRCREMTGRQLSGLSEVLSSLSDKLCGEIMFDDVLEARVMAQLDKRGIRFQQVYAGSSGDTVSVGIECAACGGQCGKAVLQAVSTACKQPMRLVEKQCEGKCSMTFERSLSFDVNACVLHREKSAMSALGDAAVTEALSEGRYLIAVSDGMGSGRKAAREAQAVLALLTKLLSANIAQPVALEVINRMLLLRSSDDMYSTLDCCCIDLHTGKAQFIKQSAMPTYLVTAEGLRIISGEALPVGIVEDAQPSVQTVQLEDGDYMFFMTDGVHDAIGHEVEQVISSVSTGDVQAAAGMVMSRAVANGANDDMTVVTARILATYH